MRPPDALESEPLRSILAREFERARGDTEKLARVRPQLDAARARGENVNALYPNDVYLSVAPGMGRFLYHAALADSARTIVEFGTSYGISTLHLAAAAARTGGRVIGTELEAEKAARAAATLKEAGLARVSEIRQGDALQTLANVSAPIDLLFLDGWKDLYLPVLEMLLPRLRPGALVLADNIHTFPEELRPYRGRMSRAGGPFFTTIVPFESGLAMSRYAPEGSDAAAWQWPHRGTGTLIGIARKSRRRAPMEELESVAVSAEGGLDGDNRGRFTERAVTVLDSERWQAAVAELDGAGALDWTLRRANLLTRGTELPHGPGGVIMVGDTVLEVTGETRPCSRMEEQQPGLLKALSPDWRGGVTCRVLQPGTLSKGDPVRTLISPPAPARPALPG